MFARALASGAGIALRQRYDYGKRVGHGSGLWFFQAGNTTVAHNQIVEGPRDAFGVYGVSTMC